MFALLNHVRIRLDLFAVKLSKSNVAIVCAAAAGAYILCQVFNLLTAETKQFFPVVNLTTTANVNSAQGHVHTY